VETNSSLPKLTVLTQNGSLSLLKRGNIYVPEERVFVDRVALQELPYNATFRVFYSSFPAGYLPPLNFSDGKFILASAVSVNVSAYGFYLNVTYPRGSLFVTGESGMGFTFGDSKVIAGNRTFNGFPVKVLTSYCACHWAERQLRVTGYTVDMKLNFSGYESHSVVVDWKPRTIILED